MSLSRTEMHVNSIYLFIYLFFRCTRVSAQFSDSKEASAIHGLPHTHIHTHARAQTHTHTQALRTRGM
jgi:hypothetical protein